MAEHDRECEVVVVGAGYSGLAAGRHLARAGVDVLVVDARHRVGGRSFTEVTEAGYTVDRGGQWIGPDPGPPGSALAAELGVATFPTYTEGHGVELREGRRDLYVGLIPTSDPAGAADGIACMLQLDLAAFDVPLHAPWEAAGAAELDAADPGVPISTPTSPPRRPAPSWRSRSRRSSARARASSRSSSPSSTSTPAAGSPTWPAPRAARRSGASWAAPSSWPGAWPRSWGSGSSSAPRSSRWPTAPTT